jgi:AAA+ superfamily predicted ATPase
MVVIFVLSNNTYINRALEVMRYVENDATRVSLQLREIAAKSVGLSGRALRKLPFLAHALYCKVCITCTIAITN